MKTSTAFPGVYRVRVGADRFDGYMLQYLALGAFTYRWKTARRWYREPTKEAVADAIALHESGIKQQARRVAFEPYFITTASE